MYKTIIVDDEKITRDGIRNIIPWKKLGFKQVFTASGGNEALHIIEKEKPDLMLTDICMSGMDGLTLIEQVNKISPSIQIIVLTGYDYFEYAQKCCKMQVSDFILKPVDETELYRCVEEQVRQLDQGRNADKMERKLLRVEGSVEQIKLEIIMRKMICGKASTQDFCFLSNDYGIGKDKNLFCMLVFPFKKNRKDNGYSNLLHLSLKNFCFEIFDYYDTGITFEDDNKRIVVAVTGNEESDIIEQFKNMLQDTFDIPMKLIVGSKVKGSQNLSSSYRDAIELLNRSDLEVSGIIRPDQVQQRSKLFAETLDKLKKIMHQNIGDEDMVLKAFTTFERAKVSYALTCSQVKKICVEISSSLYFAYISETGGSVDYRLNGLLNSILSCGNDSEAVCKFTKNFILQLFDQKNRATNDIILNAKQYINEHLTEEITVSEIAKNLYISSNYFSRLFKKTEGESCSEYIVRKRIERAKSLLETTNIKTGEVADMAGYRDNNYFSLAFKKYTGLSPTEYREQRRHE